MSTPASLPHLAAGCPADTRSPRLDRLVLPAGPAARRPLPPAPGASYLDRFRRLEEERRASAVVPGPCRDLELTLHRAAPEVRRVLGSFCDYLGFPRHWLTHRVQRQAGLRTHESVRLLCRATIEHRWFDAIHRHPTVTCLAQRLGVEVPPLDWIELAVHLRTPPGLGTPVPGRELRLDCVAATSGLVENEGADEIIRESPTLPLLRQVATEVLLASWSGA